MRIIYSKWHTMNFCCFLFSIILCSSSRMIILVCAYPVSWRTDIMCSSTVSILIPSSIFIIMINDIMYIFIWELLNESFLLQSFVQEKGPALSIDAPQLTVFERISSEVRGIVVIVGKECASWSFISSSSSSLSS